MESEQAANAPASEQRASRTFGLPRQFGVGGLLVITAMYGLLFAAMASLEMDPVRFVALTTFVTGIGLGQMLLFGGKRPREASILVGSCLCVFFVTVLVVRMYLAEQEPDDGLLLLDVVLAPALGAVLGYLAGVAIGGTFALAGWLRGRLGAVRSG